MIAASVISEVERLLAEGKWSFRDVARTTGVSHGTVARIAHGLLSADEQAEASAEEEPGAALGPLERCSGCGGRVVMPCRLCAFRDRTVKPDSPAPRGASEEGGDSLSLQLNGPHQARYEEVRRRRADDPPPAPAGAAAQRPGGGK